MTSPVPTKDRIRNAAGTAFSGRASAKPKATRGVDDEVADDVEVAAEIGSPVPARHGAVDDRRPGD